MSKKAAQKQPAAQANLANAGAKPSVKSNTAGKAADNRISAKPAQWTFLTNHTHVLILIKNSPDMPLRQIANLVGITERAVQRIVHDLDVAGYVTITRIGRKNHYWVNEDLHLRHPIEEAQTIGQLIRLVTPQSP